MTVTCEQVTTDPDAVCPACAAQLEALLPPALAGPFGADVPVELAPF